MHNKTETSSCRNVEMSFMMLGAILCEGEIYCMQAKCQ